MFLTPVILKRNAIFGAICILNNEHAIQSVLINPTEDLVDHELLNWNKINFPTISYFLITRINHPFNIGFVNYLKDRETNSWSQNFGFARSFAYEFDGYCVYLVVNMKPEENHVDIDELSQTIAAMSA